MAKPKKPRPKQRWEMTSGAWTYFSSYELDLAKATVIEENGQWFQDERPEPVKGKRKYHRCDGDKARAEKLFRYKLCKLADHPSWSLADGEPIELDPEEDFKDVKPKTADYRYLERASDGTFVDFDRDSSTVIVTRGKIGRRGEEQRVETNWDGEAKDKLAGLVAQAQAEGYSAAGEAVSFVDKLAETFGGEAPAVYRELIESGAFNEKNGQFIDMLPQHPPDAKFKVFFDDTAVMDVHVEDDALLPFAMHDAEQGSFFAIDRSDAASPVVLCFSGSSSPVADSFDAFVGRLFKRRPNPIKVLEKAFNKALKLVNADKEADALPLLEQALVRFPPKKRRADYYEDADDTRRALAAAYNLRGVCYRAAGRLDEALADFDNGMRVMAIGYSTPPKLNVVDTLVYNCARYDDALAFISKHDAIGEREQFFFGKAKAYALMARGDEGALAEYQALSERYDKGSDRGKRIAEELGEVSDDAEHAAVARQALAIFV